jgi:methylthioribose-1-phosphate isomerase
MAGNTAQPGPLDDVIGWRDGHIVAIDQTMLPHELRMLDITTVGELVDAIVRLAVRGAPVLGVAGALGVALAVRQAELEGWDAARLGSEVKRIADARPTAVNLRREVTATAAAIPRGAAAVEAAANAVRDATIAESRRISERGAAYLGESAGTVRLKIHTHCNTGSLACLGWGTALGVVRALHHQGALAHVIVDETRPLLQGARLTCWELGQLGIEHYLACDGAAPFMISQGMADAVVVGADRVAANGDVANKIGTYSLALAARQAGIPFVVAVPESTIDDATPSGGEIPLEQRAEGEVTHVLGVPAAPAGTRALNYAFDVTPAELVTAIVTEDRLIFPGKSLSRTSPAGSRPHVTPARDGLAPVVPAVGQVAPAAFGYLDVVALRGGEDPLPCLVPLGVAHALDLVETGDRVAHVPGVGQRLLALLREGELAVGQLVFLGGAQALALAGHVLAVRPLALRLPGLLDVLPGRFFLPVGGHDAPPA